VARPAAARANKGIGTRLDEPPVDFAQWRGIGIYAEGPVEDARALRPALERASNHRRGSRAPLWTWWRSRVIKGVPRPSASSPRPRAPRNRSRPCGAA